MASRGDGISGAGHPFDERSLQQPMSSSNIPMAGDRLDRKAVRRAFDRAAEKGGDSRILSREIERRMAERLDYVRLAPNDILDAGCGGVPGERMVSRRYPAARLTGVDASLAALLAARGRVSFLQRAMQALGTGRDRIICGDMEALPLADASIDLVWSNLALAWVQDAGRAFHEFHRVLRDGGLLMFSTYGPDTLFELRRAFASVGGRSHVHDFTDMHDLGDLLLASGFAEPVMDMEKIVFTYSDVEPMVRDLRQLGQINARSDRRRGLMSRSRWEAMRTAYARREQDGRIEATVEIVYGHAWKIVRRSSAGDTTGGAAPIKWLPKTDGKS